MQMLSIYKNSLDSLLTPDQSDEFSKIENELKEAWDNQIIWRTFTEANFSVLNDVKFPTPSSKYHQAVREQLSFYEQTIQLSFAYRETQIDLDEVLDKLKNADGYDKKRLEVKRDRLLFDIESMKLQARDRIRELKMWSDIKSRIDDGSFDNKNKDTDELIGLTIRYCREALMIDPSRTQDIGAVVNIIGQATTCLMECERLGIIDSLPIECKNVLMQIKGNMQLVD